MKSAVNLLSGSLPAVIAEQYCCLAHLNQQSPFAGSIGPDAEPAYPCNRVVMWGSSPPFNNAKISNLRHYRGVSRMSRKAREYLERATQCERLASVSRDYVAKEIAQALNNGAIPQDASSSGSRPLQNGLPFLLLPRGVPLRHRTCQPSIEPREALRG